MKKLLACATMLFAGVLAMLLMQPAAFADEGGGLGFTFDQLFASPESGDAKKPLDFAKFDLKAALGGFAQVRYISVEDDKDLALNGSYDYWSIPRVRLNAKMDADKGLGAFVQVDFMAENSPLMDAWGQWKADDLFYVRAGQFVIPFGWQMPISPYELATINYGQTATYLNPFYTVVNPSYAAFRDQGFIVGGTVGRSKGQRNEKYKVEENGILYWQLGLFNGQGRYAGSAKQNDGHGALCGRIGFQPIRPCKIEKKGEDSGKTAAKSSKNLLDFGISYWRESEGDAAKQYLKTRFGFDWRLYMNEQITFQGEFVTNSGTDTLDVDNTGAFVNPAEYGESPAYGFWAEFGWKFKTIEASPDKKQPAQFIQPMIKYDYFNCDAKYLTPQDEATGKAAPFKYGASTVFSLGFNYYLSDSAYFQMFYEMHLEELNKRDFWPTHDPSQFHNDVFLFQLNLKF